MRALVIDDSKVIRSILEQLLKRIGFEVAEAGNGREGLEYLQRLGPKDLVLVDWNMPEMNGLDFVQAVRADPAYASLRLMMVTTESSVAHVTAALEAGADEYVMKPFTEEVIRQKLELLGSTPSPSRTGSEGLGDSKSLFQKAGFREGEAPAEPNFPPPAARPEPRPPAFGTDSNRKEMDMQALVVDDSRVTRLILGQILKQVGFAVAEAGSGHEGLAQIERLGTLQLVLVDWHMPDMNGLEFIRAVRGGVGQPGLRLLMVTSEEGPDQAAAAQAAGADAYLRKPFSREGILEKLAQLNLTPH